MKIAICLSNVPDTTTKIKFTNNHTQLDTNGIQWIINPWDELSLTRALELKEKSNGLIDNVSVITVGLKDVEPTIRKALAIGADKGYRINTDPKDAYFTAFQIAEIARKEKFDIILCGIESSDYNGSMTGGMLAEFLEMTSVSSVSFLDIENIKIIVKREIDGGYETLLVKTPFVGIVQKGIAIEPRIPSMRGIMAARTKPIIISEPSPCDTFTQFVSFEIPKAKSVCKKIKPENMKELIHFLHSEAKVI
jgi:electron transfer flavoprotein beta subunit